MQALHLLEFIELNAILGVSHFTLYNHTIGPKASCILNHYMSNGEVIRNLINNHYNTTTTFAVSNNNHSHSYANTSDHRPKVTVDLLQWNLKMQSQKEIRTEGLFASLNDCLYRSMYR